MESGDVTVSDWLSAAADGLTSITEEAGKLVDATPALEMFNLDQMAEDELCSDQDDDALPHEEAIEHDAGPECVNVERTGDPPPNTEEQQSDWDWTPVKRKEEMGNQLGNATTENGEQNREKEMENEKEKEKEEVKRHGEHKKNRRKNKQKTSKELDFFGFGPSVPLVTAADGRKVSGADVNVGNMEGATVGLLSDGAIASSPQVMTRPRDMDEEEEGGGGAAESEDLVTSTISAILPQRIVAGLSTSVSSAQRSYFDEEAGDDVDGESDFMLEQVRRNQEGRGNDANKNGSWQVLQAVRTFDADAALRRMDNAREDLRSTRDSPSPVLSPPNSPHPPRDSVEESNQRPKVPELPAAWEEALGNSLHPVVHILLVAVKTLASGAWTMLGALFSTILGLLRGKRPQPGSKTNARALGLNEQVVVLLDRAWSIINTPAGLSFIVLLLLFMMYVKIRQFSNEMNM